MACACGGLLVCVDCKRRWVRLRDSAKRHRLVRVRNSIGYKLLREDRCPTPHERAELDAIARILGEEDQS